MLPHLVPPQLVVLKNQSQDQYFLRQYLSQSNCGEVSYHFVPKSLHTRLLCNQFGQCSGKSKGFFVGVPCFCNRNIILYLNMNDKDDDFGECRYEFDYYFPRVLSRGYDVLLFNCIFGRSRHADYNEESARIQVIYQLRLMDFEMKQILESSPKDKSLTTTNRFKIQAQIELLNQRHICFLVYLLFLSLEIITTKTSSMMTKFD